ncbi:hypothetical protein HYH03_009715 [Edaphochlamys debaryana]|uniref:Uncharacterized protein n=1 Tax=Edaphochlamys debaryana TaxID=47281 RepID=A0A835XY88_9CHLO|nr:hypothetical protein HYH03_009715 [Edaphochlamys debaryana]|eukprot:KAG2491984.1 hypothetical protein HYH03_009715 [Edaphochlamys debaryana]
MIIQESQTGGLWMPPWARKLRSPGSSDRPSQAAQASSSAADSTGPALTPVQRRLLVAAGAGIPARLLSSRPSQQAQALAQQPLRGAWRAGATYRPALRAAATAALTAAASAGTATAAAAPARAKPSPLEAAISDETWPETAWLYDSAFRWINQTRSELEQLRSKSESGKARSKGRKPKRTAAEAQPQPRRASLPTPGQNGSVGDSDSGDLDPNSIHVDSAEAAALGFAGKGDLPRHADVRHEIQLLIAALLVIDIEHDVHGLSTSLGGVHAAHVVGSSMTSDAIARCSTAERQRLAWRASVVEGAYASLPDPSSNPREYGELDSYLSFPEYGWTDYPFRMLLGHAICCVRMLSMMLDLGGSRPYTLPDKLVLLRRHLQYELDTLVDNLVSASGHGGPRLTLPELRLLTFLLEDLHAEACSREDTDMLGSGPRLGPVPAHLTSMGVLIRIVRYAAERFLHVPLPAAKADAVDLQGAEGGGSASADGAELTPAGAAAALAGVPEQWGASQAVMSEQLQRRVVHAIASLHWNAATDPKVAEAVQEAVAAGGGSLDDVEALAGALESPRTKAGRAYANAVRRARSQATSSLGPDDVTLAAAPRERMYGDKRGDAEAVWLARARLADLECDALKDALDAVEEWLPRAVLQTLPPAPPQPERGAKAAEAGPGAGVWAGSGAHAEAKPTARSKDGASEGLGQLAAGGLVSGKAAAAAGAEARAVAELRSEALGLLGPRMELVGALSLPWSDHPPLPKLTAVGGPAAALAVGAAAVANALRDWLGTVFGPVAVDNPTRTGVVHPLSREPILAPWDLTARDAANGGSGGGSPGSAAQDPFAWLRPPSASRAMVLGLTLEATQAEGAVLVTPSPYLVGLHAAARKALEAAAKRDPAPLAASSFARTGQGGENDRVASLAAAAQRVLWRDGAVVIDVGGRGDGGWYGASWDERQQRRQVAAAELADAVEALARVPSQLPEEQLVVVPVSYGGLGATSAVRDACVAMMDQLLAPPQPEGNGAAGEPPLASLLPELWDWLALAEEGSPDSDSYLDLDLNSDDEVAEELRSLVRAMRSSRGRGLPAVCVSGFSHWERQYFTALTRALSGVLGVTPLPKYCGDPIVDTAMTVCMSEDQGQTGRRAYLEADMRQNLRARLRSVLDVGELAASGLALVVLGAERLREGKAAKEAEDAAERALLAAEAARPAAEEGVGDAAPPANPTGSGEAAATSGAADCPATAFTAAQRRLLVAAGAGIPARMLSSRPSQQAAALAQQPLRGAWRAGATYRTALRAAATAALTAAASVPVLMDAQPSTSSSRAPRAPDATPSPGADRDADLYRSLYAWSVALPGSLSTALAEGRYDKATRLPGRALLLVRAASALLQIPTVHWPGLRHRRERLEMDLDALVQGLVVYYGGPPLTLPELRLLIFLLAELHARVGTVGRGQRRAGRARRGRCASGLASRSRLRPYGIDNDDAPPYGDAGDCAAELWSEALGRLGPRLELARALASQEGQAVRPVRLAASGGAAAALAVGAANAANALRDWLGTAGGGEGAGSDAGGRSDATSAGRGWARFSWLRRSVLSSVVTLSASTSGQAGAAVELTLAADALEADVAAAAVLEVTETGKLEPLVVAAFPPAQAMGGSDRVASLAAALVAALAKDGAAVMAVGGGGDGSSEGAPAEERQRRRQAAEAELAEAVEALERVRCRDGGKAVFVPLPYNGASSSLAVSRACVELLEAAAATTHACHHTGLLAANRLLRRCKIAESVLRLLRSPDHSRWCEALDWDEPTAHPRKEQEEQEEEHEAEDGAEEEEQEEEDGENAAEAGAHSEDGERSVLLQDDPAFRRGVYRASAGLPRRPPMQLVADAGGLARLNTALRRAHCRILGLEPFLLDSDELVRLAKAAASQEEANCQAGYDALLVRRLTRHAQAVLDVGELAASGLVPVVVGARLLRQARALG